MFRDKLKQPLRLLGSRVILDEIKPEYFPYVIRWRNDKELSRYINQPYELTQETEQRWYENIYLQDPAQGFMMMLDRENGIPFGTIGWTDYDPEKRQCIYGRLLLSSQNYAAGSLEAHFLMMDYLYSFADVVYAHIGIHNRKSLRWNTGLGFELNAGKWEYPSEKLVNGVEQCEAFRTKQKYMEIRDELMSQFNVVISVKQPIAEIESAAIIDTRHKTQDTRHKTQDTRHKTNYVLITDRRINTLFVYAGRDILFCGRCAA